MGRAAASRLPPPPAGAAAGATSTASTPEEGAIADLEAPSGAAVAFACATCGAQLAPRSALVSKSFTGKTGPALLVSGCANVRSGDPESRSLLTGEHIVADVYCVVCGAQLGWRYLRATEPAQAYKVGKLVLEKASVRRVLLAPLPALAQPPPAPALAPAPVF